ncbi:PREDICTED: non-specific lipid-transfer protein 1-like isoform X1 [Ipomoea nil]|uniref:non-specific lipid-transfer protein 1-like isoform X1 n=1 Tax=Ipomoea nil TaxID=35883 RepID=UPI000901D82A|nr:PREDICTED: non-specific lipid-transfer protein 1-like isoform X1 [Ipomoea nil]
MAKAACMVVMSMVVVAAAMMAGLHAQSVTCGTVVTELSPCMNYVRNGGAVPMNCCDGIRSLYKSAATTADRQTVCNCMKNAAASVPGINLELAANLPEKCGVTLPYKISLSTNCATVQ